MLKPNPPGRPPELTQEIIDRIISFVSKSYVPRQVCRLAEVPHTTLLRWLSNGLEDAINGKDSLFSQLWRRFEKEKGIGIQSLVDSILAEGKWLGKWEILKSVDAEVFGNDSFVKEMTNRMERLEAAKGVSNGE